MNKFSGKQLDGAKKNTVAHVIAIHLPLCFLVLSCYAVSEKTGPNHFTSTFFAIVALPATLRRSLASPELDDFD